MKREEEIRKHGEALGPQLRRLTDPVQRPLVLRGELLKGRLADGERPGRAGARRWLAPLCVVAAGVVAAGVVVVFGALLALRPDGIETTAGGAAPETAMLMEEAPVEGEAGAGQAAGAAAYDMAVPAAEEAVPHAGSYQEIMDRIIQIEGEQSKQEAMLSDAGAPRSMMGSAPLTAAQPGEGDILQSDGEYLYYLTEDQESLLSSEVGDFSSTLYIVKAADLSVASATEVEGTGELYLYGEKLLLVGEDGVFPGEDSTEETVYSPVTSAKIYNVADPTRPVLESGFTQEGSFVSCQVQDGAAYLVSEWAPAAELGDPQQVVPRTYDGAQGRSLAPDEVLLPGGAGSDSFAVVSVLPLEGEAPAVTRAVLGGATAVYLSKENLYIAGTRYGEGGAPDRTNLLRFEPGTLRCAAAGQVEGILGTSSPMDEHGGYLRLAATAGGEVRLYVLDMSLQECSSVRGFAEEVGLGGVLYRGDTAYVTAVEDSEELWVLDLSDPQNAGTRGKLALNGFSQQLLAVDEHTLLGFGLDTRTGEDGVLYSGGVRLCLYDVRDPDHPALADQAVLGARAASEALYEPRALLQKDGRIGFPAELRGEDSDGLEQTNFSGYFLYELQDGKLAELSRTTLQRSAAESDYSTVHILRGMLVGDTLYTASARRMAAFDPVSGVTLAALELK